MFLFLYCINYEIQKSCRILCILDISYSRDYIRHTLHGVVYHSHGKLCYRNYGCQSVFFWWGGEYNGHFYTITKSSSIIILDNYELNPIGINYFGCFFVILNLWISLLSSNYFILCWGSIVFIVQLSLLRLCIKFVFRHFMPVYTFCSLIDCNWVLDLIFTNCMNSWTK